MGNFESILTIIFKILYFVIELFLKYICWAFDIVKKKPGKAGEKEEKIKVENAEKEKEEEVQNEKNSPHDIEGKIIDEVIADISQEKPQKPRNENEKQKYSEIQENYFEQNVKAEESSSHYREEKYEAGEQAAAKPEKEKKGKYDEVKEELLEVEIESERNHHHEFEAREETLEYKRYHGDQIPAIGKNGNRNNDSNQSGSSTKVLTKEEQLILEAEQKFEHTQASEIVENSVKVVGEGEDDDSDVSLGSYDEVEVVTEITIEKERKRKSELDVHEHSIEYMRAHNIPIDQPQTNAEEAKTEENQENGEDAQKKALTDSPSSNQTDGFTIDQWVNDTISTVKDVCRYAHDTTDYDERIIEDIHQFVKNERFYTLELSIICRTIQNSHEQFSASECKQIIKETLKNHGDQGMQVFYILQATQLNPDELLDVISVIDSPITNAIVKHPFMPSTKEEDTSELQKEINSNREQVAQINRTVQKFTQETSELQRKKEELTIYMEKGEKWTEIKQTIEEKIETYQTKNIELQESIEIYKPAAMKEMEVPKNFVDNIIDACQQNNIESVIYLLQKDKSLANTETTIDGETWTPLMLCSKEGNFNIVKVLVTNGADVNYSQWHGSSLSYAKENNHEDIVDFLVEHGAKEE